MTEFQNSRNFVVLISFQPMQVENPNFELFWEACLEKSGNFILSGK